MRNLEVRMAASSFITDGPAHGLGSVGSEGERKGTRDDMFSWRNKTFMKALVRWLGRRWREMRGWRVRKKVEENVD